MAAAGVTCYYDRGGGETASLITNQWPTHPGEQRPNERGTSSLDYGEHVPCHAIKCFQVQAKPAGTSKRMGAFYEKTGCLQHRTEPGFTGTKGACGLTEGPHRRPQPGAGAGHLCSTGSMVLSKTTLKQQLEGAAAASRPCADTPLSRRSRSTAASHPQSVPQSVSGASNAGSRSSVGSVPSWAKRQQAQERPPWNFDPMPMYARTNATYGVCHEKGILPNQIRAAGRSESGFLDPGDLIATLTRHE